MSYNLLDYKIVLFYDEEDGYGAYIQEIPKVSAFGENFDKALEELKIAYSLWLESTVEKGYPLPVPFSKSEKNKNKELESFSGKFSLRLPRSLHRELVERSKIDNVSLNQELIYCLTRGLYS